MGVIRVIVPGLAPLLAALALAGCASTYGAPINGEAALSPEEQRLQAVENKTVDLSRRLGALESSGQSGSTMGDELRELRGQVEQLRHDVDSLQQQQQQQYADMDARLKRLELAAAPAQPPGQAPPAAPAPGADGGAAGGSSPPPAAGAPPTAAVAAPNAVAPAPPAAVAPAATVVAPPASAGADEEAIYLKSVDLLRANKLDEAIRGFRGQLEKYPQGSYADNAWYWTGQAFYIKQNFAEALKAYQALLQQFPASPKVPEALLRVGVIYQDQQKSDLARTTYQRVIQQFPNSTAASQARTRLAQLR
jgi:tol-pal system protein YbgF